MYKLAMAFLLLLNGQIVNAQAFQSQKPVICDSTKTVINYLTEKWSEKPVWVSKDSENDSRYVLLTNEETKTWTLIQMTKDIACVLGLGVESTFMRGKQI